MSDRAERTIQFAYASKSEASGAGRTANEPTARERLCRPVHPGRCPALRAAGIAIIALVAALTATLAPAQAQFTGIYGFGDSYADTGGAPGGAFRLAGTPAQCITNPASCRFTGGTNFVESLQAIYGLSGLTNYAIGGARTDNTNTLTPQLGTFVPGFAYELQQLQASGTRFSKSDLIAISIGGNDLSAVASVGAIQADATASAQKAVFGGNVVNGFVTGGVSQMIAAGANNIAWLSTGSTKYFPIPPTGAGGLAFTDAQRDLWANTYYQQLQQLLAPFANSGVRIFLFNFGILQQRIWTNPVQYGFNANPTCQASLGEGSNCFYNNGVHPTPAAMALIATFMANQINSPTTVVPQGSISTGITAGFTTSVLGRLDAERTFSPFGMGTAMAMAYAGPTKALGPVDPGKRWSIYGNVDYGGGSRDTQFLGSSYNYTALGGTIGVDYRHDQNWKFGGVFSYSQPVVNLGVQNAHNRINAYQLAGYGSFTDAHWFADGLLVYGRQDFSLDRWGVTDAVTASTHADTFTAAARGGYLFDVGRLRAGPIAGLTYMHAVIQGYTEAGDILLTMMVDRQTINALTGNAGLQLRLPFVTEMVLYSPFINLTAEQDFAGSARNVTTTLVTAPLLPILTPVSAQDRTYGRVAAGIGAGIAGNINATLTVTSTFARAGGNDFAVSSGIRAAF